MQGSADRRRGQLATPRRNNFFHGKMMDVYQFELDSLDEFYARLREHFSDADILDLTICIADFLAFGRLTEVLRLDQECSLEFP